MNGCRDADERSYVEALPISGWTEKSGRPMRERKPCPGMRDRIANGSADHNQKTSPDRCGVQAFAGVAVPACESHHHEGACPEGKRRDVDEWFERPACNSRLGE